MSFGGWKIFILENITHCIGSQCQSIQTLWIHAHWLYWHQRKVLWEQQNQGNDLWSIACSERAALRQSLNGACEQTGRAVSTHVSGNWCLFSESPGRNSSIDVPNRGLLLCCKLAPLIKVAQAVPADLEKLVVTHYDLANSQMCHFHHIL